MLETLQAIVAITLIDLAMSGDNALVIGMVARGLPRSERRRAIVVGAGAAVALRVAAAAAVTLLLTVRYLHLAGSARNPLDRRRAHHERAGALIRRRDPVPRACADRGLPRDRCRRALAARRARGGASACGGPRSARGTPGAARVLKTRRMLTRGSPVRCLQPRCVVVT